MKVAETINISLPVAIGKQVEALAKEERRTVGDFIQNALLRYRAKKLLLVLATESRKVAKRKKLTPKDLGGPFAK